MDGKQQQATASTCGWSRGLGPFLVFAAAIITTAVLGLVAGALVAAVTSGVVVAIVMWSVRRDFGPGPAIGVVSMILVLVADTFSEMGVAPRMDALRTAFLMVAFLPVLVFMAKRQQSPGVQRRAAVMYVLDVLLISSGWTVSIWKTFWSTPALDSVHHTVWVDLGLIFAVAAICSATTLDLAEDFQAVQAVAVIALSFFMCYHIIRVGAGLGSRMLPLQDAKYGVLVGFWVFLTACMVMIPGNIKDRAHVASDRNRGLLVGGNLVASLNLLFVGIALNRHVDWTSLVLVVPVVLVFGAREWIRTEDARERVGHFEELAMTDVLTGLGNRRSLTKALSDAVDSKEDFAVIVVNLDRFRELNERFGHVFGDSVLIAVGHELRGLAMRHEVLTFRLSGDEFAIVTDCGRGEALALAERCRVNVASAVGVPARQMGVSACVGVAWTAGTHATIDDPLSLLNQATEALRIAKTERDSVQEYTPELAAAAQRRGRLESRLRQALACDGLDFAFQPIMAIETGRIVGVETLARWHDPELGFVSPAEFVPVAERTGLIHELGMAALYAAAEVAVSFQQAHADIFVTVNVSPLQLRVGSFIEQVTGVMMDNHLPLDRIKLEVTENVFMDKDDPAVEAVNELSDRGFTIALDDFGTGYSSLGYVSRMPFSVIKIDRSLTLNLDDPTINSVIKALVEVSKTRGMSVVPEGVETIEVARKLKEMGVDWAQGWLWSKAVSFGDLSAVLQRFGYPEVELQSSPRVRMPLQRNADGVPQYVIDLSRR